MKPALVSRLNFYFLVYSVVAIVVTLFVHAALYFGFNLRTSAPNLWTAIQLSLLVTAAGVVFCYRHPPTFIKEMYEEHSTVLLWLTIFFAVFLFYAIFNVFYWDRWLHFGYLDFREGHYVIVNKGRIVRSLSPSEVPIYQFYQARKYSGHWMICNTVLCLFAFMNVEFGSGGVNGKEGSVEGRQRPV